MPVKADRVHLTLHFLGGVPAQRLPQLAAGLRVPFEPFSLELGHGDVWPNGVAVLQPATAPDELHQLHAALGQALKRMDLPVETRPFLAHITLARHARGAKPPPEGPGLQWRIDDGYVLVRSLPGGAGYQILERVRSTMQT